MNRRPMGMGNRVGIDWGSRGESRGEQWGITRDNCNQATIKIRWKIKETYIKYIYSFKTDFICFKIFVQLTIIYVFYACSINPQNILGDIFFCVAIKINHAFVYWFLSLDIYRPMIFKVLIKWNYLSISRRLGYTLYHIILRSFCNCPLKNNLSQYSFAYNNTYYKSIANSFFYVSILINI